MSKYNVRNLVIDGNEYAIGVVHTGTAAERKAYSALNGDKWNEVDSTGKVTEYTFIQGLWKLSGPMIELVNITVSSSDSLLDLSTVTISVKIDATTKTYTCNASGECTFTVEWGKSYTITFPQKDYYYKPSAVTFTAMVSNREVTKVYNSFSHTIRQTILERANPDDWAHTGSNAVIDLILSGGETAEEIDHTSLKHATFDISGYGKIEVAGVQHGGQYEWTPVGESSVAFITDSLADGSDVIEEATSSVIGSISSRLWTDYDLPGSYVIDPINKTFARLNPSNGKLFIDGTLYSGVYGDVFRHFPPFFYRLINVEGEIALEVSASKNLSSEDGWIKLPNCWLGAYKACFCDDKTGICSRYNGGLFAGTLTMSQFWTLALSRSTDYGLMNYTDLVKIMLLFYSYYNTANSLALFGTGNNVKYTDSSGAVGGSASLGDGSGSTGGTNYYNRIFGLEQMWGSQWEFRPGIRFKGRSDGTTVDCYVYDGNRVSNTVTTNLDGTPCRTFTKPNLNTSSYPFRISKMCLTAGGYCDFIPSQGESNTNASGTDLALYYCDATWSFNNSGVNKTGELLRVGGSSDHALRGGLSASRSDGVFSASAAVTGARLAFYGDINDYQYVTGAEISSNL